MDTFDVQQLTLDNSGSVHGVQAQNPKRDPNQSTLTASDNLAVASCPLILGSYTLPVVDHSEHSVAGGAHGRNSESGITGRTVCAALRSIDVHERADQPGEGIDHPGGEKVYVEPFWVIRPEIPEPADCTSVDETAEVTNCESMG